MRDTRGKEGFSFTKKTLFLTKIWFDLQALCVDAYDEVDRRSANELWAKLLGTTEAPAGEHFSVPFLPTNPIFSATRNQGRQKLARLTGQEFATLLVDTLQEARARLKELSPSMRRSLLLSGGVTEPAPEVGEEDPVYDQVPADESDFGSAADVRNALSAIAKATVNGGAAVHTAATSTTTATAPVSAAPTSAAAVSSSAGTAVAPTAAVAATNSTAASQVRRFWMN